MATDALVRLGRWCFRHRWTVVVVWALLAIAGGLASGSLTDRLADSKIPHHVESIAARDLLASTTGVHGEVLGLVDGIDPNAAQVRQTVAATEQALAARSGVAAVRSPYSPAVSAQEGVRYVAADGRAFLVVVALTDLKAADRNTAVDDITLRLHRLGTDLRAAGQPGARVRVGGEVAFDRQAILLEDQDLERGELVSLPITLVVLVIVFGGLAAATLPVVAAAVSVTSAMLLLLGFTAVTDLDSNAITVVTVLGLGLCVDYGLLLVARYREELAAGSAPVAALERAWATAGRTIMFSALTVAAAIAGLLMFDLPALAALGAAGVSIALIAMSVALTFTAATIGLLHRWIRPAKPSRRQDGAGFFSRLGGLVQRRAALIATVTTALLLAAGAPLLTTAAKLPGLTMLPPGSDARQVGEDVADRFTPLSDPTITVVARTDPAALDAWAARWKTDPAVAQVRPAESVGNGISRVDLDVTGDRQGTRAQSLVRQIRADRPAGTPSWVTGDAAVLVDLLALIRRGLPGALTVTLTAMVLLLFAYTGSVVIPVKAILASVVSLGATFGMMSAVFARGWFAGPLHTLTIGGLDPFIVVIIFAFAFGLSVDYEVFLLGRIKEYVQRGEDTEAAVRHGLQNTGRIITSAALVMLIVFVSFATARMGEIEQIGLGLSIAVLVDATVVRCLLVPATMTLLGRWNWWAPGPLRRLYERFGGRPTHDPHQQSPV